MLVTAEAAVTPCPAVAEGLAGRRNDGQTLECFIFYYFF